MLQPIADVRAEALGTGKLDEKRTDPLEKLRRDQLVAASDAIRNDPVEQAELRKIMTGMGQISAW